MEEEEEVTLKTLDEMQLVNEGASQVVPLSKDQPKIQSDDKKNDANFQEAVGSVVVHQETNGDQSFQTQQLVTDKVDNQTSDQVLDHQEATEVVLKPEERLKTNLINPASFLIHRPNKTDDLVNEANLKDKFAQESTKELMNEFNDVPSDGRPGKVDVEEEVIDLESDDPANEFVQKSELGEIGQSEDVESGTVEEKVVDFDLIDEQRGNNEAPYEGEASKIVEVRLADEQEQVLEGEEVKLGRGDVSKEEREGEKSKVGQLELELVRLGGNSVGAPNQRPGQDPSSNSFPQTPQIREQPKKESTSFDKEMIISETEDNGEAEKILSRVENEIEETTTTLAIDTKEESSKTPHSKESFTEKVPNLFPVKYESEKKQNQVLDILQANLNREEPDDENTFEADNNVETTSLNRRLPEFYPGTQLTKNYPQYLFIHPL